MEEIHGKSIKGKERDDISGQEQQKILRQRQSAKEPGYRVVSDENSIYEYDLSCVKKRGLNQEK